MLNQKNALIIIKKLKIEQVLCTDYALKFAKSDSENKKKNLDNWLQQIKVCKLLEVQIVSLPVN